MLKNLSTIIKEKTGNIVRTLSSLSKTVALASPASALSADIANYELVFLFDQSGSMCEDEATLQKQIPSFLNQLSLLPGSVKITFILFDHRLNTQFLRIAPSKIKTIYYQALGSTALLDAYCSTINFIHDEQDKERENFETIESEKAAKNPKYTPSTYCCPVTYIFTLTDGEENSSSQFNWSDTSTLTHRAIESYGYHIFYFCTVTHNFEEISNQYNLNPDNVIPLLFTDDCYENILTLYHSLSKTIAEQGEIIGTIYDYATAHNISIPSRDEIREYNAIFAEVFDIEAKVSTLEHIAHEHGASIEFYDLRRELETNLSGLPELISQCNNPKFKIVIEKTYKKLFKQVKHAEALCYYIPAQKAISANSLRLSIIETALEKLNNSPKKSDYALNSKNSNVSEILALHLENIDFVRFRAGIEAFLQTHKDSSSFLEPIRDLLDLDDNFVYSNYLSPLHTLRMSQYNALRTSFESILEHRRRLLIEIQYAKKNSLSPEDSKRAANAFCFDSEYCEWLKKTFPYTDESLFQPFNNLRKHYRVEQDENTKHI
ncbi:MAG: VWA domain-containing protein [Oscillospiraceae bacterium]|jgi:hypothetical protein|nr:VWA domain-containing protein [Oscillospiraceae bacterium]